MDRLQMLEKIEFPEGLRVVAVDLAVAARSGTAECEVSRKKGAGCRLQCGAGGARRSD